MMRVAVVLLVMASVGAFARQAGEDPAVLLERAVQLETIDGDLDAAIAIYKRIVEEFGDRRSVAAKALLRLGGCYEKLGEEQAKLARKAFERVIADYPEQTEAVNSARERLSAFLQSRAPAEKADREYKITKVHMEKRSTDGYFSPDGKKLAMIDYDVNGLWLRDIASGREDRILSIPSQIVDCWWSPDSHWIAYLVDYAGDVYAIPAQGGEPKMIIELDPEASKTGDYVYPMGWTSDSKKLTFQTAKGLFAVPGSGGKWEEIYKFPDPQKAEEQDEWLTLSPDGTLIAYQSKQDDNMDIYVMPARGGEPVRITDDPARDDWPIWSYDGRWLMFESDRTGEDELWVIRIKPDGQPGGQPIQVTRGGGGTESWTKDGKIAYSTSTDLTHIFIANMDGSEEIQLTGQYKQNFTPRWSPDGKNIAFAAYYGEGVRTGVMTVPSSGGDAKFLARGGSSIWSPNGKKIAFHWMDMTGAEETGTLSEPARIYTINVEGGEPKLVTDENPIWWFCWTPDGRHIIFSKSGESELYIVSSEGGKAEKLNIKGRGPDVSPDGKKIAYSRRTEQRMDFWLVENFLPIDK